MEGQERTRLLPKGLNPAAARVHGMVSWQARVQAARHGAGYVRELGMPWSAIAKRCGRTCGCTGSHWPLAREGGRWSEPWDEPQAHAPT